MASKLFIGLFLVAAVLINTATAQLNFQVGAFAASQFAATTSDWYLVTLPQSSAPTSDVTLTITHTCGSGTIVSFNPSSLTFSHTHLQNTFTITTGTNTGFFAGCVVFTVTGTNATTYNTPATRSFTIAKRNLFVAYGSSTSIVLGDQNNDVMIDCDVFPPSSISITPNGTDLTFIPSTITVGPTGGATFKIRGDVLGTKLIQYTITGTDSGIYNLLPSSNIVVGSYTFDVTRLPPTWKPYIGETSTYHLGWVDHLASFSVQLDTEGTVIGSPMDFSSVPVKQFRYSFATATLKTIDFTLTGAATGFFPSSAAPLSYTAVKRDIYVSPNGDSGGAVAYLRNQTFPVSVGVRRVPISGLTISAYSADCTISPTSQTLTGGIQKKTAVVFLATCSRLGDHFVEFVASGVDVPIHNIIPASFPFTIAKHAFDIFYPTTTFYTNTESPAISVSIQSPPPTDVTLWPQGQDLIFTPPSLTFTSSTMRQTFTVTSTATTSGSVTISWIIVGTNKDIFAVPANKAITVGLRPVSIYPPFVSTVPHGTTSQQYTIYSDVPGNFTVNFASAHADISPSVVTLTSDTPYARFNVTGKIRTAASSVQYVLGGIDAGWYLAPTSSILAVPAQTFVLDRVDIPLASTPGFALNTTLEYRDRFATHYRVSTLYNPSRNVTIIPRSRELHFNPSVLTFTPHTSADGLTFTVDGDVSGVHQAWFELDGYEHDVNFFANPNVITFTVPADIDVVSTQGSPAAVISPNHLMIAMFVLFLASLLF